MITSKTQNRPEILMFPTGWIEATVAYFIGSDFAEKRDKDSIVYKNKLSVVSTIAKEASYPLSNQAAKMIKELDSFKNLKDNWNGYGASKPTIQSISKAIQFVKKLDQKDQLVYFVTPNPDGDILIELKYKEKSLEIYVSNLNIHEYIAYEDTDARKEGTFTNISDLQNVLSWLNMG